MWFMDNNLFFVIQKGQDSEQSRKHGESERGVTCRTANPTAIPAPQTIFLKVKITDTTSNNTKELWKSLKIIQRACE